MKPLSELTRARSQKLASVPTALRMRNFETLVPHDSLTSLPVLPVLRIGDVLPVCQNIGFPISAGQK
jgi:hypothetical protein